FRCLLAGTDATCMAGHYHRDQGLNPNGHGRGRDCRLCARSRSGRLHFYRPCPSRRGKRDELRASGHHRHYYSGHTRRRRPRDYCSHHNIEGNPCMSQYENTGAEIELVDVVKKYPGQAQPAVRGMNLTIPAGEIVMFVGPSGCGKTTTVKMINRLIEPTSGKILIDGEDAITKDHTTLRRSIGYVIQGGGLMPHMTVADNIALVPGLLHWEKDRIRQRVDELLEMTGLDPEEYRDRYPRELSGGQQQRVGVARGLAADPPVVLMDEPFGAVDPITRQRLQDELLGIQEDLH